jgi:hypothetical protein
MIYIPFLIYKFFDKKKEEDPLQFTYIFNHKPTNKTGHHKWTTLHIYFNYSDYPHRIHEFLDFMGSFVNEFTFVENACILYVRIEQKFNIEVNVRKLFQHPNFTYTCLQSSQSFLEYILEENEEPSSSDLNSNEDSDTSSDSNSNDTDSDTSSDTSFCVEETVEYQNIIENNKKEFLKQELDAVQDEIDENEDSESEVSIGDEFEDAKKIHDV